MRAVWVGLVGAVLAVGSAVATETSAAFGAQQCALSRAVITVAPPSAPGGMMAQPVARPDLAGKTFNVVSFFSTVKPSDYPAKGQGVLTGSQWLGLQGDKERAAIEVIYSNGQPARFAVSAEAAPAARSRAPSVEVGRPFVGIIQEGPLQGLVATVTGCRI